MKLSEVILLSSMRLRNIAASKENGALALYIYMGVADLYNRFNLSIQCEVVTTAETKTVYTLTGSDVLLILDLYDDNYCRMRTSELTFDDCWQWKMLNYNTFMLNRPSAGSVYCVYKGSCPKFPTDGADCAINIPDSFMDALLLYVSWHFNMSVSSPMATNGRGGLSEADIMKKAYEEECNRLELQGYKVNINTETVGIALKGYV